MGGRSDEVRSLFESRGLLIQEWDKVGTDWLTIRESVPDGAPHGISLEAPTA